MRYLLRFLTFNGAVAAGVVSTAAFFLVLVSTPSAADEPVKASGKAPVEISADRMEAYGEGNRVVFKGDVEVLEDFTLCSDELTLNYGESGDVDNITATGNVWIYHEDKVTSSGVAVYDRNARTLVLTGEPKVQQCTDAVSGTKITVYLDENRALVEGDGGGRVRAVIMPEKDCTEAEAAGPEKDESGKTRCRRAR